MSNPLDYGRPLSVGKYLQTTPIPRFLSAIHPIYLGVVIYLQATSRMPHQG